MIKINLKHVVTDIDRNGDDRFFFHIKDQQKVRLPGILGSKEFMETYQETLRRQTVKSRELQRVSENRESNLQLMAIFLHKETPHQQVTMT